MPNSVKIEAVLQQMGWQKNTNSSYASMPFQLIDNGIIWHAGFRWLKRHRYLGVTPDSAIRYRTNEGLRIKLNRVSLKPSRLLITNLSSSAWMRWLLHHGLKLRGFKRHQQQLGNNQLYHQDAILAEQLIQQETFIIQCEKLAIQTGVLRWELCLIPGKLTINLTLINEHDMTHFPESFYCVKQLAETLNQTPHSQELSLTVSEAQQISIPLGQIKKTPVIKGGLIVLGVLLLSTATLMLILFSRSWQLA